MEAEVKMTRCSYCGKEYSSHKGLTLILNSGHLVHFCSSKCRKNNELGRDSKKRKWSKHKIVIEEEKEE